MIIALLASILATSQAQASTLANLYEQFSSNNHALASKRLQHKASKLNHDIAVASLMPRIDYTLTQTNNDPNYENIIKKPYHSFTIQQNICNPELLTNISINKKMSKSSKFALKANEQQAILILMSAWINYLRACDYQQQIQAEAEFARKWQQRTSQQFNAGLVAKTPMLEATASLDKVKAQSILAKHKVTAAFLSLEQMLQIKNFNVPKVTRLKIKNIPKLEYWHKQTLSNNPDLIAANFNLAATKTQISKANAKFLPNLALQFTNTKIPTDGNTPGYNKESLSYKVSLNILQGGANFKQRKQAAYNYLGSKAKLLELKTQTSQQVINLHNKISANKAQIEAMLLSVKSSEAALDAITTSFEAGQSSMPEVLEAKTRLLVAKRNHKNSQYEYILNFAKLHALSGSLNTKVLTTIDEWIKPA